jgi:hypothetical protein
MVFHEEAQLLVETADTGVYRFSGDAGDAGLAVWDRDNNWLIVDMEEEDPATAALWYVGKTTGAIGAGSSGTAEMYTSGWTASGTYFTVANPHDIELPEGLKIRWTNAYYGWAAWVAEPWQWTECPAEGYY